MLSSINNISNLTLDMSLDKTREVSPKHSTNSAFVKDKSNAVSEVLGYSVDSEGFFTSDFNEAAGIAKSFKIHAKQIKSFYDAYTSSIPTHNSIDIAKTLGNAYKAFEKDMGADLKQNYSVDEFTRLSATNKRLNDKLNSINALQKELDTSGMRAENVSWGTFFSLSTYTKDERIDKSALFALYISSDFIEGEVNMYGKIMGLDKTMSKAEVVDLQNFINDNKILGLLGVGANPYGFESIMRASDLSVEEFKEKWLEFKARAEKEFELNTDKNEGQSSAQSLSANSLNLKTDTEQSPTKKRSPIQVTSKSETYTNSYFAKYKNLLMDTQKTAMFEILFGGAKSGISNGTNGILNGTSAFDTNSAFSANGIFNAINAFKTNSADLNTNLMNLNLSQIKPLSGVDIKA